MKSPSRNVSQSLRGQNNRPTTGPGPSERGRVKQGQSAGIWPGTRTSGQQPPGRRQDNSAEHFADIIKGTGGV